MKYKKNGVVLRMELPSDLPRVLGDRVQSQRVILNLVMDGIEANGRGHGPIARLADQSVQHESDKVLVAVQDSGIGLQPGSFDHLFEAFFMTNPQGMRKELGISRSTVEDHGRRLWAVSTDCYDATFQFTVSKYHLRSGSPPRGRCLNI
jgi:signal transduction histidine kinase